MKLKIKKQLLFDILKKHLSENRTHDNPTGNFIHTFNKSDDTPISPSEHMSVQLSVEKPPVDDPDYVPGSVNELISALSVIAREVPITQIKAFYQDAHLSLDKAIDHSRDILGESINLLNESETLRDKYIQKAADKVKMMISSSSDEAQNLIDTTDLFDEFEDDIFPLAQMIDDAALKPQNQAVATAPKPIPARPVQKRSDVIIRKKKKEEPEKLENLPDYAETEDVEDMPSYGQASDKTRYMAGFDAGTDVALGLDVDVPGDLDADFRLGYEDAMAYEERQKLSLEKPRETEAVSEPQPDDIITDTAAKLAVMTHRLLFDLSRQVEADYFNTNFTKQGREAAKAGIERPELNATSRKYGISNKHAFTYVNLTKKDNKKFAFTDSKIKLELKKFITKYISLNEDQQYLQLFQQVSSEKGLDEAQTIEFLAKILAEKYVEDRQGIDDIGDDEFLDKISKQIFSIVSKSKPYSFMNVSVVFMNRAKPEMAVPFIKDMIGHVKSNLKDGFYVFKKKHKYTKERFENAISGYAMFMFERAAELQAKKLQNISIGDDVDEEETDIDQTSEKEAERFAKQVSKLATTTNFDNLAPFFGFSGASGMRQWYLKHVLRKFKMLKMGLSSTGNRNAFAKIYEETFEAIGPYLVQAMQDKIKSLSAQKSLDDYSQMTVTVLSHALPQVQQLDKLIKAGKFMTQSKSESPVGNDLLYTAGGYLMRAANSEIYRPLLNKFDKQWTDFMADVIQKSTDADKKLANSLAEYFTGKKEIPNFDALKGSAKKLISAGIDFEGFKKLLEISNEWFEDTLETEFSSMKTEDETVTGEFLDGALKVIQKLTQKPNEMQKYLDKALNQYIDDIAMQVSFRKLSQFETKSGD